jgi:hypothetical protein
LLSGPHSVIPAPAPRQPTLLDLLDRILDKGVVINGDITLSFASVDLLSLKVNLVIASLETAKRYGIELPWEKWERERLQLKERKPGLISNNDGLETSKPTISSVSSPQRPTEEGNNSV